MANDRERQREELIERLLAERNSLPTSSIARIGRTLATTLRIGRVARARLGEGSGDETEEIAKLVAALGQLKGVAMKVGQIMSYIDVALPADLRRALSVLQRYAPPMPIEQVRGILRQELGDRADDVLLELELTPLAAASIGQVHRTRLADGTALVVKLQYPEIESAIRGDSKLAGLGKVISSIVYSGSNVEGFLEEARTRLLEECDYLHEADAQCTFAAIYEGHPAIVVPRVHRRYCSRRALTSTYLAGRHFESSSPQGRHSKSATALAKRSLASMSARSSHTVCTTAIRIPGHEWVDAAAEGNA